MAYAAVKASRRGREDIVLLRIQNMKYVVRAPFFLPFIGRQRSGEFAAVPIIR